MPVDDIPWAKELSFIKVEGSANLVDQGTSKADPTKSPKAKVTPKTNPNGTSGQGKRERKDKRKMFDEHLAEQEYQSGVADSKFVIGTIRLSKKNRRVAYVTVDGYSRDFIVVGSRDRNRAMQGDKVVLEYYGEVLRKKCDNVKGGNELFKQGPSAQFPLHDAARKSAAEVEESDSEEDVDALVKVARVVAIALRRPGSNYSGFLMPPSWRPGQDLVQADSTAKPLNSVSTDDPVVVADELEDDLTLEQDEAEEGERQKNIYFKPMDNRCPFMVLSADQLPEAYFKDFTKYKDKIYICQFHRWPSHCLHPYGKLGKSVGMMGDIVAETEAILETNSVRRQPFAKDVLDCLPELPFVITEDEVAKRKDLRKHRVFTIDPETAKDLDDAVSVEELANGNLSVGVHIADVSHFIKKGCALDNEAQKRATTTYMVQRAYPMLPSVLCEDLCSLNPGVDRLSFSVIWTMTPQAQIVDTWFGRSVICSCIKMSYQNAQNLIDGNTWEDSLDGKQITGKHTEAQISKDVKLFHKLSLIMRQRRFDGGALTINQPKLTFRIDDEMMPTTCQVYELKDSNRLIEEFMLLANMSVAQKISEAYSESAMLRCHPPPTEKVMKQFLSYAERLGCPMTATTAGELQKSILAIPDEDKRQIFQLLAIKPMQRAKYFSTGETEGNLEKWRHYALNCDMYTHFTSPIRRYADVVVHRQLQAALDAEESPLTSDVVAKYAAHCNVKKEDARSAQDDSLKLYLCVFLKQTELITGKPTIVEGIVMDVSTRSLDVYVPSLALDRRVYLEDCGALKVVLPEDQSCVTITWPKNFRNIPPYSKRYEHQNFKVEVSEDDGTTITHIDETIEAGEDERVDVLKKIKVRICVEGRSPMNIKAYMICPAYKAKEVKLELPLKNGHESTLEEAMEKITVD